MKQQKLIPFLIAFFFVLATATVSTFSTRQLNISIEPSERTSATIGLPFLFLSAI